MAQYSVYRPWATRPSGSMDQLRREMNALFEGRAGERVLGAGSGGVFPPTNLYETADGYVLTAEIPGVEPSEIQVSVEDATISIQGERQIDPEAYADGSLHRTERRAGSFRRAFALPARVDVDKIEAVNRNGVLILRIPKSSEAQPRQISVQPS